MFTREVAKKADHKLSDDEMDRRVRDQLERLSIAALAMFNRGRQDITEAELGADMAALNEDLLAGSRPAELGQRLIGEFFFVHAAEAQPLSPVEQPSDAPDSAVRGRATARRSYEFLHATFCEYLVASRMVNELVDVAETALAGRRSPREPEDDLLFALLSHQPLAARRSTVSFAKELSTNLSDAERSHTLELLELLIESYRRRYGSDRYASYRPTPLDRVRQLAAYSANLVMLRVALEPNGAMVPLAGMLREPDDTQRQWHLMANLWRAGLDADGLQAMLASLTFFHGSVRFVANREIPTTAGMVDIWFAQLVGDSSLENRLRFGMATRDGILYWDEERHDWAEMMASWLIPRIAGVFGTGIVKEPPPGISETSIIEIATLIMRFLKRQGGESDLERSLIRLLFDLPRVFDIDKHALAAAVIRHPPLVALVPELGDPRVFGESWNVVCMKLPVEKIWNLKDFEDITREVELRTWRSHHLQRGSLPKEIEPAIDELLRIYSNDEKVPL